MKQDRISIPLELGSGAFYFVDSVFGVLVQLALIGICTAGLLRPPPYKPFQKGVSRAVLAAFVGLLVVTGWPELASALEGWRELF